jgi:hypothetical protein
MWDHAVVSGFKWASEVEAVVMRAVQYVLLYEETKR